MPSRAKKIAALIVATGIAVLLVEVGLRLVWKDSSFVQGFDYELGLGEELFVVDEAMGFRPRLDTRMYDVDGAKREARGAAPKKRRRVAFLGDSVTFRAKITKALREHFGAADYEYWNCGVESFNTTQEVAFYELANHRIRPDHVVLTFHHNDFSATPAAIVEDGVVKMRFANRSVSMSRRLYKHSYLYRLWFQWRVQGEIRASARDQEPAVRAALQRLQARLQKDGVELTVLVLPTFKPEAEWSEVDRDNHRRALWIMQDLRIRHFDLKPVLAQCVAAGETLVEMQHDAWHPSREFGARCPGYLVGLGFGL